MLEKLKMKYITVKDIVPCVDIPYYELNKMINGEIFRKYFIFDIRKMSPEEINIIFSNFDRFNYQLLEDEYFSIISEEHFDYRKNMSVLFMYSSDREYDLDKNKVLYNMEYALKSFVTEEELADIISKSSIEVDYSKIICFSNDGYSLLPGFNLIYGLNGSGKSRLLFDFYSHLKNVPMYNMNNWQLNLLGNGRIKDLSLVENYLKRLNEMKRYDENSNIMNYFNRLSQVLAFCKEQNSMVLLDNLGWEFLDVRNKINVLDTLFDYSCDNCSSVVVTSCQDNIKKLVRNRIYNPNIIEVSTRR